MEERHILDRTWVAACEPKRRRNELNDYSAAARRLFRKDRAFRSWMEEVRAPRQHALDAFDEFNAKRGPWQRLLRERRENRMVVVTTEAEASRAPEGRHQAGDLGDWGSAAALLYKNKVYRKWRAESPPDEATWEIFTEKRGPWDRRCRARRDRRRAQGGRDAREWRRRMLPCERAAIDSSRAATRGARSRQVLLDRVPARAAADPLTPSLATFETFTRTVQPREENDHMHGGKRIRNVSMLEWAPAGEQEHAAQPSAEQWEAYHKLCDQNVTNFSATEEAHPVNFFEQRDVCGHCGTERFVTMQQGMCCQHGKLVLEERVLPPALASLITSAPGLSKQSRVANDLYRFAQMALPKGTHRMPDSYQHLKVTGIPFAILTALRRGDRSAARRARRAEMLEGVQY